MKKVHEALIHHLNVLVDKAEDQFFVIEMGNTVFGPMSLTHLEDLISVLKGLQSQRVEVLTKGKIEVTQGIVTGVLRLKGDMQDCINPYIYIHYELKEREEGKNSCYFKGSLDDLVEDISNCLCDK